MHHDTRSTRVLKIKQFLSLNETVKMELLDQKLRKHFLLRQHVLNTVCLARRLLSSKATIRNKLSSFPTWNFVVFSWKCAFFAQWKFTIATKAAIFRYVQTRHTRIFIIFILKTTSIGSHVREKSN